MKLKLKVLGLAGLKNIGHGLKGLWSGVKWTGRTLQSAGKATTQGAKRSAKAIWAGTKFISKKTTTGLRKVGRGVKSVAKRIQNARRVNTNKFTWALLAKVCVLVGLVIGTLWLRDNQPEIFSILRGVVYSITLVVVILGLVAPLYIPLGWLTNKPIKDAESGVHFFTFIEPGRVKIIRRGDSVVRMVMDTAGKRFARVGEREAAEFWQIVDGPTEGPLKDIVWWLRPWAWYVFKITGAVFTGIYPFQRVREYALERTKISTLETPGATDEGEKSNIVLTVVNDISDHYRLRQFDRVIHIKKADTKDKIPLDVLGVAEAKTINPHQAAFGSDGWDRALDRQVTDKLNEKTRTLTLDAALTADTPEEARAISNAVLEIRDDSEVIGMETTAFKILQINPVLPKEEQKDIRAEALSIQRAKATVNDGKARAQTLRDLNDANVTGGEFAVATMQTEGVVRAAEAVGKSGGQAIFSTGGQNPTVDPIQAGILAELKKLNKGKQP